MHAVVMTAIQTPSSPEADDYFTATIGAIIDGFPLMPQPRGNI
ncbi:hypothetical protein [Corynebacterium rouxii]|nr:hypothetical protein [Corynebacterium rouxii]